MENSGEIIITSVVKMTPQQIQKIKISIQKKLKVDLPAINKIDASLIGGFTVSVKDWFMDTSLSQSIESIKRTLLE